LYLRLVGRFETSVTCNGDAGVPAALWDRYDAFVCDLGQPKKRGLAVGREPSVVVRHLTDSDAAAILAAELRKVCSDPPPAAPPPADSGPPDDW
jgi:hypothetical protein